jgi:hypothetical protein
VAPPPHSGGGPQRPKLVCAVWSLYVSNGPPPDQVLKDYSADHIYGLATVK